MHDKLIPGRQIIKYQELTDLHNAVSSVIATSIDLASIDCRDVNDSFFNILHSAFSFVTRAFCNFLE